MPRRLRRWEAVVGCYPAAMSETSPLQVRCWVLHAFDVARAISLPACLWNVQKVLIDQAATRRSEWLEWIIIALIAFEIAQALLQ